MRLKLAQPRIGYIHQSDLIHDDIDDFVANKDVEGTGPAYKIGLSFRGGQQLGPTHKDPEGKLRFMLLGDDESDNGDDELLLWKADNSLDQADSMMKFNHEEHSVTMQSLSKTHSPKIALTLWLLGLGRLARSPAEEQKQHVNACCCHRKAKEIITWSGLTSIVNCVSLTKKVNRKAKASKSSDTRS
ncbi:hypothetical protein E3N88_11767 [Mikania micrantha]|uniref:Uncharacterized protein n=1 Tax=Mikania micrantha TaxID=192012 RepID=A0A5N6P514_9ASTR|nr:hypothetical protein E3N88_11767 [Mikania micrantha]